MHDGLLAFSLIYAIEDTIEPRHNNFKKIPLDGRTLIIRYRQFCMNSFKQTLFFNTLMPLWTLHWSAIAISVKATK